jgi:CarD family transcriptional regulator
MAIEEQEIAGFKLELFVVTFAKEKMTLRVPTSKVPTVGMRKLSTAAIEKALEGPHRPRPHQAHHVVAPRPGI